MRLFLFLIFILSITAYAQTPWELKQQADKAVSEANRELLQVKELDHAFLDRIITHKDQIESIQSQIENKRKALDSFEKKRGGIFGLFTNESFKEHISSYEKTKNDLRALEEARDKEETLLKKNYKNLSNLESQMEKKTETLMNAKNYNAEITKEYTAAYEAVKKEMLNADRLMLNHEIVENKLATVGLELDTLKSRYDSAMLGVYVRDRILKLLNSKTFCDTAKTCAKGEDPTVIDSDLNSVFPGQFVQSPDKPRSSQPTGSSTTR